MTQKNETSFDLTVSYSQIAIFDGVIDNPFNDWEERHVSQGFTWRDGSVSFKTLIQNGKTKATVISGKPYSHAASSVRTISVPFICHEGAEIEIATITESHPIQLESGEYQLIYETGWSDSAYWCRFSFVHDGSSEPQILIRDAEIAPVFPLLMHAEPA